MIHQLKCGATYFGQVVTCEKTFEVRKKDRDFQVGDFLALNEVDEEAKETGQCVLVRVTYIFDEPQYCKEGTVIMEIRPRGIRICRDACALYGRSTNCVNADALSEQISVSKEGA